MGVAVGLGVGVRVGAGLVGVGEGGSAVGVGVGVGDETEVKVGSGVGVGATKGVGEAVAKGVADAVAVAVPVRMTVGEMSAVRAVVRVAAGLRDGVPVGLMIGGAAVTSDTEVAVGVTVGFEEGTLDGRGTSVDLTKRSGSEGNGCFGALTAMANSDNSGDSASYWTLSVARPTCRVGSGVQVSSYLSRPTWSSLFPLERSQSWLTWNVMIAEAMELRSILS